MFRKFLFFIVFILIFGCQNKTNKQGSIEDFIPKNAQVVLRINSMDAFKSVLKNNDLLSKTELKSIFENNLVELDSLKISGPLLVCITKNNGKPNFTFISQQKHIATKQLQNQNNIQDSVWVLSTSNSKKTTLKKASNHPYKKFAKLSSGLTTE